MQFTVICIFELARKIWKNKFNKWDTPSQYKCWVTEIDSHRIFCVRFNLPHPVKTHYKKANLRDTLEIAYA